MQLLKLLNPFSISRVSLLIWFHNVFLSILVVEPHLNKYFFIVRPFGTFLFIIFAVFLTSLTLNEQSRHGLGTLNVLILEP